MQVKKSKFVWRTKKTTRAQLIKSYFSNVGTKNPWNDLKEVEIIEKILIVL